MNAVDPFMMRPMQTVDHVTLSRAVSTVRSYWPEAQPKLGIILGSGWGCAVEGFIKKSTLVYTDIPGFGKVGAPGHAGTLCLAEADGAELFIFQGRRHVYEGDGWTPVLLPIWIMSKFGAQSVLLTNASGGIRPDLKPGRLMVIEDHINGLGWNPLIGPHEPAYGERFPDQTEVYSPRLRQLLLSAGADTSGVYYATHGPTFETPAEIRAFRSLGADVVGMSTVPEAIFANALGMNVAGLSCVCNWAAGLSSEKLSEADVLRTAGEAMPRMRTVLDGFMKGFICKF
ncbi:MAG: purine-nucleoside phosphorylase [Kiritimatiellaceae bacterium]|nr:purine-nucleoside phosphorylase [Kiritimatiellaceae bacterium]